MLRPTKHAHPDKTVLSAATIILAHLKSKRVESYVKLLGVVKTKVRGGHVLFLPAVNLLFLLGVVAYHSKTDSFEYASQNETV